MDAATILSNSVSYTVNPTGLKIHPAADTIRMMDDREFAAHMEDIRVNGQVYDAVMYDGMLLDGRNRRKACEALGIKLKVIDYPRKEFDPIALVYSLNVARRHLTAGQLAALGSDLANTPNGGSRNLDGLGGWSGKKDKSCQNPLADCDKIPPKEKTYTRDQAAAITGGNGQRISEFRKVESEDPELAAKVRAGEESLTIAHKKITGKDKDKPKPAPDHQQETVEMPELTEEQFMEKLREFTDVIPQSLREKAEDFEDPELFSARSMIALHDKLMKELSPLSKPEAGKVGGSVMRVLRFNQRVFEQLMQKSKTKYWKDEAAKLKRERESLAKQKQKLLEGKVAIDAVGMGVMLKSDFKRFLGALHPDKHPGNEEKYAKLFNDFKAYEQKFKS